MWGNHRHPLNSTSEHFDLTIDSRAPFGRGFASEDPILDRQSDIEETDRLGGFTPGGWCLGSSLLGKDPSGVYGCYINMAFFKYVDEANKVVDKPDT
ncbi:uncharacterized protein A4U43_C01F5060 [Asparagus officinalis]|uniref:Uncharacterized protein n=1 Tax=Asparagus officinalis TaxID=4686 RepID=A0A5P1FQN5_ASPOF|nr:uncharacterized protein A4U43_C01F5060 [Asparagus officinalis]